MFKQVRKVVKRDYVERKVYARTTKTEVVEKPTEDVGAKNKSEKKNKTMTEEQLMELEAQMGQNAIKRVKKDKGLIERTESSKIILTEDNRQVLTD